MTSYEDKAMIEYLRRSYAAVDGLWFTKVEDACSCEEALRLDEQVWDVMPKIQARKAREVLGIEGQTLSDLSRALGLKFASEGYEIETEETPRTLRIHISTCPWLDLLRKSGKMERAKEICDRICMREFAIWAREFSPNIRFSMGKMLSTGDSCCDPTFEAER